MRNHDIPDVGTGQGVAKPINSSITDCNVEVPHMKPVNSSRADGLAWVIADKAGLRQRLLQELGCATIHFHHDLHSRTQCQNMINELTLQSPWLLWIRFAGSCAGSGNRLDAVGAEHLCRIIRYQQQCSRAVIVEANERSQVWNLQAVRECMNSLALTIHQMCNYEVSLGSTQSPCCSRIRVLTNFPLQNRGTCECGNAAEHVHQRDLGNSDHRRFAAALKGLMNTIVRQASAVFQHTGQAPGNPQPEFIHDKTKTVRFSSLHVRDNLDDYEPELTHVHQTQLSDSRLNLKQSTCSRPVSQVKLDQATCSGTEDDYWLQGSEISIIRVHTTPRLSLFVPSPSDCPFPLNRLHEQRKTHVRWTQHSSLDAPEEHLYVDSWKEPHVSFNDRWTGATVFSDNHATCTANYPTESAIRQKQRKADGPVHGPVSVPRKKIVEQHQDDCGTNLSSIADLAISALDQREDDNEESYHTIDAVNQMFCNARAVSMVPSAKMSQPIGINSV